MNNPGNRPVKDTGYGRVISETDGNQRPAVLKLLGIAPDEAEEYIFRAVVLKETRLEPDTEGIPLRDRKNGMRNLSRQ
jgi:hypothetical protein